MIPTHSGEGEGEWERISVEKNRPPSTDPCLAHPQPTSPHPLKRALRFSANSDFFHKLAKPVDPWSPGAPRTRAFSMASKPISKGKDPDAFDSLESGSFSSSLALDDMVPFTKKPSRGPSLTRPATADPAANGQRRYRGSILGAASDALRFGRRRRSIKEPPPPPQPRLLLPDVIEVRASALTPTFDEEEEAEREQLRAAAVQSVGFDVDISRPPDRQHSVFGDHQQRDTNEREDRLHEKECENGHASPPLSPISLPPAADCSISDASRSTQIARLRGHMSSPAPIRVAQPTSTSATAAPGEVPAFPSTRAQVAVHEQLSATLPKHYPPPSLLMLALSKQWKARHVVLSAPVLAGTSYLHVFKSSAADERELERLEINERSVVFVNDEDVGGRRGVVRVGGVDVGARRELNGEENGMTIMMLQILDSNQSQNWINAIKNAVLGQRSVRAGLGIPSDSSGAVEPRGDLDVMLSMRKQGILSSPVKPSFTSPDDTIKLRKPGSSEEMSVTPRPSSIRSRPVSPRAPNGVLSLKSLFSVSGSGSSRPRSASSARPVSPDAGPGEFLGSAASSLLNMRARADSPIVKPYSMLPPTGPALDPAVQLQRKIIDTQSTLEWAPLENSKSPPRPMSPSLNPPPPRRRAYTTNEPRQSPSSPDSGRLLYNHGNASTAGSFGIPVPEATRPPLERASSERGKPRTSSVSSTATTESGSARRWSRQSNASPRPTPPDDDDSSTPVSTVPQPSPWQNGALPSNEFDPSPSRSSLQSQKTLPSFISGLHGASKRASTSSSVQSVATTGSNMGTFSIARSKASGHRMSVPPPPRPAPSTALPPTPTGSDTENPVIPPTTTVKAIRRNSLARRALRLSLGQPALPVQPHAYAQGLLHDGANTAPTSRSHSRSTSVDSMPRSALSHSHVIPQALLEPPSPPPTRPLPPPPSVASASTRAPLPPIPRTSSFKQRLRILSAPSGRSTPPPPAIATVMPPVLPTLEIPTSMPATPICEHIANIVSDADFLNLDGETPVATVPPRAALGEALFEERRHCSPPPSQNSFLPVSLPPPRGPYRPSLPPLPPVPPPQERSPQHMTVLSPPPRKGSIRPLPSPSPEMERGPSAARESEDMLPLTPPPLDLVRNTSTLSLSIVSGAV